MEQANAVSAVIQINSHSVRNLASLDKKVQFTASIAEEEVFAVKFAQWLSAVPVDQLIKCTFEFVEE